MTYPSCRGPRATQTPDFVADVVHYLVIERPTAMVVVIEIQADTRYILVLRMSHRPLYTTVPDTLRKPRVLGSSLSSYNSISLGCLAELGKLLRPRRRRNIRAIPTKLRLPADKVIPLASTGLTLGPAVATQWQVPQMQDWSSSFQVLDRLAILRPTNQLHSHSRRRALVSDFCIRFLQTGSGF